MCYFTYKFYECKHRGEDHIVKCDKRKNDGTGTHCNPDQRGYKSMPECGIKLQDLEGLCRVCSAFERKRLEDEEEAKAIQRDLEKARQHDLEEQRRNAEAHEAHLKRAKTEDIAEWERRESERLRRILAESRERQERDLSSESSGTTIPLHRPLSPVSRASSGVGSPAKSPTGIPPPPPLPPTPTSSGISAASLLSSKAKLRAGKDEESPTSTENSTAPPSTSNISADMIAASAQTLRKARDRRPSNTNHSRSMPAAFPPIDYSQVPQDQNYGRFMIGTRHQPIHPSQEASDSSASPTTPSMPIRARAPAPTARLAGSMTPVIARAPTTFQMNADGKPDGVRPASSVKRPPSPPTGRDSVAEELAAMWARRGIQRDDDDDE